LRPAKPVEVEGNYHTAGGLVRVEVVTQRHRVSIAKVAEWYHDLVLLQLPQGGRPQLGIEEVNHASASGQQIVSQGIGLHFPVGVGDQHGESSGRAAG